MKMKPFRIWTEINSVGDFDFMSLFYQDEKNKKEFNISFAISDPDDIYMLIESINLSIESLIFQAQGKPTLEMETRRKIRSLRREIADQEEILLKLERQQNG